MNLKISAVVAAMALLVPAAAIAKKPENPGSKGKGHAKVKLVTANVTGAVVSNDGTTLVVTVAKASGHAKACKGKDLSFDISNARIHSADGVAAGDVVKVQGKISLSKGRKTTCNVADGQVLPAKQVHDRTSPEPEEAEETETEG